MLTRRQAIRSLGLATGLTALGLFASPSLGSVIPRTQEEDGTNPKLVVSGNRRTLTVTPFTGADLRGLDYDFQSPLGPLAIHAGFNQDATAARIELRGSDGRIEADYHMLPELQTALLASGLRPDSLALLRAIVIRDQAGVRAAHQQIAAVIGEDFDAQIVGQITVNGRSISTTDGQALADALGQLQGGALSRVADDFLTWCAQYNGLEQAAALMPSGMTAVNDRARAADWKGCAGCGINLGGAVGIVAAMMLTDGFAAVLWWGLGGLNGALVGAALDCSNCF